MSRNGTRKRNGLVESTCHAMIRTLVLIHRTHVNAGHSRSICTLTVPMGRWHAETVESPEMPESKRLIYSGKTTKKGCLKEGEEERLPSEVVHSPWHTHRDTHGPYSPCLPPTLRSEKPLFLQHIRESQRQETSVRISETFMGEGTWNSESQVPPKYRASASALHPHVVQRQSSLLSLPST